MNLQIGTILIAKEDIFMDRETTNPWAIKENPYKIVKYRSDQDDYMIIDEEGADHYLSMDFINQHFTIKRYTLQDLKTRTDLMVRIDSEEQAKKFGDEWTNIRYFKSKEYYGYIENHKDIAFLTADEKQNRTLVPFDLIDFEMKEEVLIATDADCVERIKQLESEIARLKGENEELETALRVITKKLGNKEATDHKKRERMAWEVVLRTAKVEEMDTLLIRNELAFKIVDDFLAKSKEVKP